MLGPVSYTTFIDQSDINAMLARKSQLQTNKPAGLTTMEKSRLNQARTLAQRRHDYAEVAEIDAQLVELAASTTERHNREPVDLLAKVNERNRKANMEAVRKAEIAEAERKRRDRKHGKLTTDDPSARLKTVPRLFNANTPTTRFVLFTILQLCSCEPFAHHIFRPCTGPELRTRLVHRCSMQTAIRHRDRYHLCLLPRFR